MYVRKTYDLGHVIQVEKYYPGNYGAPGVPRERRRKRTPEDIRKQNEQNRIRNLQRLILANFHDGDWHLVLTFRKDLRPADHQEAKQRIQKFLRDMRSAYKRAGHELKYIYIIEQGSRGAWHFHLILEDITEPELKTKTMVRKFWPYGQTYFTPLYDYGEYEQLADYLVKRETKEEGSGCTYSRSRNLVIPEPKREVIHHRSWKRDPQAPAGWYVVQESVVNGENPVTRYPYQKYTLRRYKRE